MVNKCIYFYGTLLKDITEVAEMKSGVFKNVSVKKVVTEVESEGVKKNVLEALKIKFKEEKHGKAFIAACSKWFFIVVEIQNQTFLDFKIVYRYPFVMESKAPS